MRSDWKEYGLPCPCGKSSDAYAINYKDWGKCFSCGKNFPPDKEEVKVTDENAEYIHKAVRGLTKETCEKWNILTKVIDNQDAAVGFVFPNGAVKVRDLLTREKKKRFSWSKNEAGEIGEGMFGWNLRRGPQHHNTLVITEGLIDSPSIDQAVTGVDVCSVDSSASAYNDISSQIEEINKYRRVVLAFDADEAGQKAIKNVLSLFQDPSKLFQMTFNGCKDANELLQKDPSGKELVSEFLNVKRVSLTDFIHTFSEVRESLKEQHHDIIAAYPLQPLQDLLRGLVRGRVTVWKGMEGIGKTELFRFIEYNALKTSKDCKIAVIHMEEGRDWTIKGLATYEANRPMYFTEEGVSEEEIFHFYKKAVENEDRFFIYKVRGSDDPDEVLTAIRNIVVSTGVDIVFLDNIQKMVDGIEEEDVRQKLVYLSAKLKDMAEELNFALEVISHVNDDGKALNSRYITKVFDRVVHMERDIKSPDEVTKNTISFTVEKNRGGKGSGPAGLAKFNTATYKLEVF